jgi:phage shock protein A
MFTFLGIGIGILVGVFAYSKLSDSKIAFRLRGLTNRSSEKAADRLGNIVNDRKQKIVERQEINKTLREQLGQVKSEIILNSKRHEEVVKEAEKYNTLAQAAVQRGNEQAAREALSRKQEKEKLANVLLQTVQTAESAYNDLKGRYDSSTEEVKMAETSQASFQAEFNSLALRKRMQESSAAFGGIGNLDFSSSESELEKMRAEVQALDEVDSSTSSLQNLEQELGMSAVDRELNLLKARKKLKKGQTLKKNGKTYVVQNETRAFCSDGSFLDLTDLLILEAVLYNDNYYDLTPTPIEVSVPAIEHQPVHSFLPVSTPEPVHVESHSYDGGGGHSYDSGGSYDSGSSDCGGGGCD